jgi:inorganic pyrophosphatase
MILPDAFTDNEKLINVVIETPKGSHNKYTYDREKDFFKLTKTLPLGTTFPFDFGFVPNTLADDGDPLDILVFMESSAFTGCIIECRCIGVIEATQKEKKEKKYRNDRIVAVANEASVYSNLDSLKEMNPKYLNDIINFFKYYNEMEGKKFEFLNYKKADAAIKLIKKHLRS